MVVKVVAQEGAAETITRAIESGVLAVEAERAYKSILEENTALKAEINRLREDLKMADEINRRDRDIWLDALTALMGD